MYSVTNGVAVVVKDLIVMDGATAVTSGMAAPVNAAAKPIMSGMVAGVNAVTRPTIPGLGQPMRILIPENVRIAMARESYHTNPTILAAHIALAGHGYCHGPAHFVENLTTGERCKSFLNV